MHFNVFRIEIPKSAAEVAANAGNDFTDAEWVAFENLASKKFIETTKVALSDLGISA